jgi:hypothetical protein
MLIEGVREISDRYRHRHDRDEIFKDIYERIQANWLRYRQPDTPYQAAVQVLRYGAVYMLYRREPELARRFSWNRVIRAKRIALKVMAPQAYYAGSDVDLPLLEQQFDSAVGTFARLHLTGLAMSFQFLALPSDFEYRPGMDSELIRDAVRRRTFAFAN